MANKACINRLQKEYRALLKDPVPSIQAHPSPSNLLEWHYVLQGPKDSDYEGGVYHGKVVFPSQYPYKPPSIVMITPNGRFTVNQKLCLSMTDFHPESWNPMWSVGTILTGLMSFMSDTQPTSGSINSSTADKKKFAAESLAFNLKSPAFRKLFPDWVEIYNQQEEHAEEVEGKTPSSEALTRLNPQLAGIQYRLRSGLATAVVFLAFVAAIAYPFLISHVR